MQCHRAGTAWCSAAASWEFLEAINQHRIRQYADSRRLLQLVQRLARDMGSKLKQKHTLGLAALHQQRHNNDLRLEDKAVLGITTHELATFLATENGCTLGRTDGQGASGTDGEKVACLIFQGSSRYMKAHRALGLHEVVQVDRIISHGNAAH